MKGKLFLSGGGDVEQTKEFDVMFFSELGNVSKILYIPIALNRDTRGFESCYDWFSSLISLHSDQKDIDFSMVLNNDEIPDLQDFDAIYIGGGNTYKLLDYVYRKKLKTKFIDFINSGKKYLWR